MRSIRIAIVLSAASAACVTAAEISVGPGAKYETIVQALANARIGDRLVVKPGTYRESIVWPNVHGIQLVSEQGPKATILQGDGKRPVIQMEWEHKWDTLIEGFTICGGGSGKVNRQFGAGLNVVGSSPMIRNCIITQNFARPYRGTGGIFLWDSRAVIEHNQIIDNRYQAATLQAGGICAWEGMPKISKNVIQGNSGEQEAYFTRGAGLRLQGSKAFVSGNIFRENVSTSVGSAIYASQSDNSCIYGNEITANRNLGGSYGAVAVESNSTTYVGGDLPSEANAIHDNIHAWIHEQDPKAREKIRNLHSEYFGLGGHSIRANWYGGADDATLASQLQKLERRPAAVSDAVKIEDAGLLKQ